MIHYAKAALRTLLRHKEHSFINIAGLAIGMASCLLLFLWVEDELSYDRYHEKAKQIYRVVQQYEENGQAKTFARTPAPLAPALMNEFPQVQRTVRFGKNKFLVKCKNKLFYDDVFFADPGVFDVFTFPLAVGSPDTVLKEPYSILISEEIRDKCFGKEEEPIGETIALGKWRDFKITGIFKNIPRNSHFKFHFLGSFLNYRPGSLENWAVSNFWTYILIEEESSIDTLREKLPQFLEKYRGKALRNMHNLSYLLQPLSRIHLHSHLKGEIEPNRDIGIIYIFSGIALFILFIACLNYINFAVAGYSCRTREMGLRKVLGAGRAQLIRQFLGESLLFSLIALPLALFLAKIFLPLFNSLSGKTLTFQYFNNFFLFAFLFIITLFVGLVPGIFPALFISKVQPAAALKGMLKKDFIVPILRRALVVFQFVISITFIISTIIISNQLHYMRTKNLGFNKKYVVNIAINHNEEVPGKYGTIKREFLQNANVVAVSASGFYPGKPRWNMNYWHEGVGTDEYRMITCISVDHDFFETLQIRAVEGRCFSKDFSTDAKNTFIINESARKEFGWKSAVGKKLNIANWKKGTIIGVVEDFHFNSLHQKIKAVVFYIEPPDFEYFLVRLNPGNISQTLGFLENKWRELVPGQTFDYSFLEDKLDHLYKTEIRLGKIFMIVTILSIFIAGLGLFGIASFTVEHRSKEIGIRKVLGASAVGILLLLSGKFIRWVLMANIIAWPIAWYVMDRWLQNFSYRVHIDIWTFFLAGLLALVTALLTVSHKAIRTATTNPVQVLRDE